MAMTKCKECGKVVSDKAKSCPNCGYNLEKERGVPSFFNFVLLGAIIAVAFAWLGSGTDPGKTRQNSRPAVEDGFATKEVYLPPETPICKTEDFFDRLTNSAVSKDVAGVRFLMTSGACTFFADKKKVIIVDYNLFSATKIRFEGAPLQDYYVSGDQLQLP